MSDAPETRLRKSYEAESNLKALLVIAGALVMGLAMAYFDFFLVRAVLFWQADITLGRLGYFVVLTCGAAATLGIVWTRLKSIVGPGPMLRIDEHGVQENTSLAGRISVPWSLISRVVIIGARRKPEMIYLVLRDPAAFWSSLTPFARAMYGLRRFTPAGRAGHAFSTTMIDIDKEKLFTALLSWAPEGVDFVGD